MRKGIKSLLSAVLCGLVLTVTVPVIPQSPLGVEAQAHGGRTDSHGGHRDNKNASGLGSYHYHCGGYPPHLHENGVCPYDTAAAETTAAATTHHDSGTSHAATACHGSDDGACGWKKGEGCMRYRCEDGSLAAGCWKEIDGCWYSFDENCHMRTGWYDWDGDRYYLGTDGKMVTGDVTVDGVKWSFDKDGKLVK